MLFERKSSLKIIRSGCKIKTHKSSNLCHSLSQETLISITFKEPLHFI